MKNRTLSNESDQSFTCQPWKLDHQFIEKPFGVDKSGALNPYVKDEYDVFGAYVFAIIGELLLDQLVSRFSFVAFTLHVVRVTFMLTFAPEIAATMIMNFLPIIVATIASYIFGSLWYVALGKPWRAALNWDVALPYRPSTIELLVAFVGQFIMAVAMYNLIPFFGIKNAQGGLVLAAVIWVSFLLPSVTTNVVFQRRNVALIAIDAGHWLLIVLTIGGVLGALT